MVDIDICIPYVNNKDKVWQETYINFCYKNDLCNKIIDMNGERYSGINLVEYQLKLIKKNMSWVRNIYLILSNKEQKPHYDNDNVIVVYHKDFIPYKYLPTFNSTTIEMFLWNIKGLSEYFIYANDDMLPTKYLEPSDFFSEGKIKIKWIESFVNYRNRFYTQCTNGYRGVCKALKQKYSQNTFLRPIHSFTPMIKSHAKECFDTLSREILPHIRAFRTFYQYNQYIYPLWELKKYGTLDSTIDFCYNELDRDLDLEHQIVCINLEKNKSLVNELIVKLTKLCE